MQAASEHAARLEAQHAEARLSSAEPSTAAERSRYEGALTELRNLEAELASARAEVYDARAEAAAQSPEQLARLQQLYSAQLQTLAEMGFFDAEANLRALVATRGNVQAAIERLLR